MADIYKFIFSNNISSWEDTTVLLSAKYINLSILQSVIEMWVDQIRTTIGNGHIIPNPLSPWHHVLFVWKVENLLPLWRWLLTKCARLHPNEI